jgi:type II secretory pathway component PulF
LTRPLSTKQQIAFAERLSYLLGAGISLVEGLGLVELHLRTSRSKKAIKMLGRRVGRGDSLSVSLRALRILDGFSICAVSIGETTGTLTENLRSVAEQLKNSSAIRNKLLASLTYPAIILISTIGLSVFLISVIFPKIRPLFVDLKVPLPFSTRVLMGLGMIPLPAIVAFVVCLVVIAIISVMIYKKSIVCRWYVQKMLLHVPMFGSLRRDAAIADLFRMLGILLKSGTGLQASFVIIRDVSANLVYKNECIETAEKLERGEQLSDILKQRQRLFPPAVVGFLAIGELTGNMSEICLQLSAMIENDIDENVKRLSALVEPLLMLIMGTIVGFVALAIITPLYAITQNIK